MLHTQSTASSDIPLGDWYRAEVLPRLTVDMVFGDDVQWTRAGAWLARPCPLHNGERDSFHVHPETLAWKCHSACQASGDAVHFIKRRDRVDFPDAVRRLAALVGLELPGYVHDARTSRATRATARVTRAIAPRLAAARPAKGPNSSRTPPRPPPSRPPAEEVAALWASAVPVTADPEAAAYLASRAIDPARVEDQQLARVLPPADCRRKTSALPRWARFSGRSWAESGHRLVLPLYGAIGRLESLRARLVRPARGKELKALAATRYQVAGLVLAEVLARRLLAGDADAVELVRHAGLWIAEGEIDFLTLATAWSDADEDAPAVLGLVSGAWTPELAARLPDGCTVTIATDADNAGQKYADEITDSLRGRKVRVQRWSP